MFILRLYIVLNNLEGEDMTKKPPFPSSAINVGLTKIYRIGLTPFKT